MECKQSLVAKLSHQLEHVIRISRTKPWTYKPNTTLCPDELFCSSSKASSLPLADPFPIPLFYTDKLSSTFPVRRRDRHYCLQLKSCLFQTEDQAKGFSWGKWLVEHPGECKNTASREKRETRPSTVKVGHCFNSWQRAHLVSDSSVTERSCPVLE